MFKKEITLIPKALSSQNLQNMGNGQDIANIWNLIFKNQRKIKKKSILTIFLLSQKIFQNFILGILLW